MEPPEHPFQGFAQVLEQMPAVGDLWDGRIDLVHCQRIVAETVPSNHFNARMGFEPSSQRSSGAVGQQVHRNTAFQVDEDRSITTPFGERPVVNP